jgi:hypothetical protein
MPTFEVFCACGAQWHGAWVDQAQVAIARHRIMCGAPISHQRFIRRFRQSKPCLCRTCREERARQSKVNIGYLSVPIRVEARP